MLETFRQINEKKHDYARDWKVRTGGKVLGYFCCYVPEELLYAAGILPVRVIAAPESPSTTERHIFGMFCPFSRGCLHEGLAGRMDYVDGVVYAHTCLHMRQTYECWYRNIPSAFHHHINVPAVFPTQTNAVAYMKEELQELKEHLEGWTGQVITDEALDRAVEVFNTNRRLLGELYALRMADSPVVSGAEVMEIVLAGMVMDKAEHNALLEKALRELPGRTDMPKAGQRLMIVGGECSSPELLRIVEEVGGSFVADDLCMGSRYFMVEVEPGQDRLQQLAKRYLDKPSCPTKDVKHERRFDHILSLARDYRVVGALLVQQKFCDPHELDYPLLARLLKENQIPTYFIELESTIPHGQLRTRTEAFLEIMELDLV